METPATRRRLETLCKALREEDEGLVLHGTWTWEGGVVGYALGMSCFQKEGLRIEDEIPRFQTYKRWTALRTFFGLSEEDIKALDGAIDRDRAVAFLEKTLAGA